MRSVITIWQTWTRKKLQALREQIDLQNRMQRKSASNRVIARHQLFAGEFAIISGPIGLTLPRWQRRDIARIKAKREWREMVSEHRAK